uniref:Small ribosomal subunit protein mS26 n=1 Tax=Sphenodon punctatus TaxID=8508 RepID=A0A8D0GNL8_SPHPU
MFPAALARGSAPLSRRLFPLWTQPARGRKSRDVPPAKSKAGRVKMPPPVDPAELLVVTERYRQYRLVVSAVRAEFKEEQMRQVYSERVGELAQRREKELADEHARLMAFNNAENERLHELRLERLRKEEAEEQHRKAQGALEQASLMEEFLKEKEREVLQLQVRQAPCRGEGRSPTSHCPICYAAVVRPFRRQSAAPCGSEFCIQG